ncbi:response regulator transcription factor [Eremococcus coleocola]|uniref:Response regulator receiver domain protein n=1 Tax=Eremococcus coleocola ACS-139-V-Col8 TaxID=908337 RepID=E4KNL5_9LACT|nr:response regulator transcription factor [Eremococcus coleocola]EFR31452.1 response regulator receiver domain protein [Eremococcus coleocola ACS-139-V-Col8]
MRVLVVDDEKEIVELLTIYLKNESYDVLQAFDGVEALDLIAKNDDIDLVLLDIMMPKKNGLEVLEEIRKQGLNFPVIFLTAKATDTDKITGLFAGADDYVAKPFNPLEVIARIKSLFRRQQLLNQPPQAKDTSKVEVGSITIEKDSHTVTTLSGQDVQLTGSEFDILYLLATHLNQVFSAEDILQEVWPEGNKPSSQTVMVHVSHLRDKLEAATNGEKIVKTVWGLGYKIVG